MKITVLMGSPNKKGSTNLLIESFQKGALEKGHDVEVIDIAHKTFIPALAVWPAGKKDLVYRKMICMK